VVKAKFKAVRILVPVAGYKKATEFLFMFGFKERVAGGGVFSLIESDGHIVDVELELTSRVGCVVEISLETDNPCQEAARLIAEGELDGLVVKTDDGKVALSIEGMGLEIGLMETSAED
jgi:hypothetical protein